MHVTGRSLSFGLAVAFECVAAGIALALAAALKQRPLSALSFTWTALGAGVAAAGPMWLGYLWLSRSEAPIAREMQELVRSFMRPLFSSWTTLQFACLAIVAGFAEELLFRGVLQPAASAALGPVSGLMLSALLFGSCHALSRTYFVLATGIGLWLGGLWLVTDNLLAPMTTHALYDFAVLRAITTPSQRPRQGDASAEP